MLFIINSHWSIFKQFFCNSYHNLVFLIYYSSLFNIIITYVRVLFLFFVWFFANRLYFCNKVDITVCWLVLFSCNSSSLLFSHSFWFRLFISYNRLHLNTLYCSDHIIALILLIRNTCIFMHSKNLRHIWIWKLVYESQYLFNGWIWIWNCIHRTIEKAEYFQFICFSPFYKRSSLFLRTLRLNKTRIKNLWWIAILEKTN